MKATAGLAPTLTLLLAAPVFAQGPPMPGPEHEILRRDVGTWDVAMEMQFPGMPAMTMYGTETSTLLGGRWLVSEFRGEAMGMTFEGHGIAGWDPAKKTYVRVWADNMSTSLSQSESNYDAATNSLKGFTETADPSGTRSKARTELTWPTAETRLLKVFGPDGSPEPVMKITYTKRK